MKVKPNKIRFFSPVDNADEAPLEAPKATTFTTMVTKTGRLAFPQKLMEGLRIDPSKPYYKVGTVNRRKGVKVLYLMPTEAADTEAFELSKTGRGYSILLKGVLQKMGLNFQDHEYTFTITPYEYGDGVTGFELVSDQQTPRTGASDTSDE